MTMKIPEQWKATIKQSKIAHTKLAHVYGIGYSRFKNIFYGLVHIREDEQDIFSRIIDDINNGRIVPDKIKMSRKPIAKKTHNKVVSIICNVCEKPFKPWGGDLLPICKRCFEMNDSIRKRMILLKQGRKQKKPQIQTALYWEYQ